VANIKSAEKRWRQSLKRRMRNRGVRTAVRTHIKTVNRSLGGGEADADELKQAVRALDKAAEKGIIHPNNAARRKSRLMHKFAVVSAGGTAAVQTTRTRSSSSRSRTAARTAASRAARRRTSS
jgi:small subunit ribosomal protein S20